MTEIELVEKTALSVGMKSLLNHGAASCVYSEGCNGVTQEHLVAFMRTVAAHCVAQLVPGLSPIEEGAIARNAEYAAQWSEPAVQPLTSAQMERLYRNRPKEMDASRLAEFVRVARFFESVFIPQASLPTTSEPNAMCAGRT